MLKKIYSYLYNSLLSEREDWFSWVPVFFGIGIIFYLKLPTEPSLNNLIFTASLFLPTYFLAKKNTLFLAVWIIALIILLGFANIYLKAHLVKTNMLPYEKKFFRITGTIESMQQLPTGMRVLFKD